MVLINVTDNEVEYVAAEPHEVVLRRKRLERLREMGQLVFKKAMGQLR
jgi:hypothetical protein